MLHRTETNLSYTLATFGEARALKNFESWIVSTGLGFFKTEGDLVSDFHLYTEDIKKSDAPLRMAVLNTVVLGGSKIKVFLKYKLFHMSSRYNLY